MKHYAYAYVIDLICMTYYAYFIMTYNEYMKAYRIKHRDRINAQQRSRRSSKPATVNPTSKSIVRQEPAISHPSDNPKPVLCMRPLCDSYETDRYNINGRALYLCVDHQPK